MPAYYLSTLAEFVRESPTSVVGKLADANTKNERFQLSPESIDAWRDQLPGLFAAGQQAMGAEPLATDWPILLEYPIPQVGKRIDAVILAHDVIIVFEVKTGGSRTSAVRQVEDYCVNLACFHEPSRNQKIVPLAVSAGALPRAREERTYAHLLLPTRVANWAELGKELVDIIRSHAKADAPPIDVAQWNAGRFRPIPPIIDAAVALYSGHTVFEIGHSCAAQDQLEKTTGALVQAAKRASQAGDKAICFVTGVPGAGKTLVGLNAVHHSELRNHSAFLSGNGPLVKIIREALTRNILTRRRAAGKRQTRADAEQTVHAFVRSVHQFASEHYRPGAPVPAQRVIVFDEGQRAWDAEQNKRAKRPEISEPAMMLEVMNRIEGWATIIALVGSGQEINRGEAGLAEWGRALAGFPDWRVYASPFVLDATKPGPKLFLEPDVAPERVASDEDLHLSVATRAIRAQRISEWVDAVLEGDSARAAEVCNALDEKPAIARHLNTTRQWLLNMRRGFQRIGLLCSASAARLRADGLEPTFDFHRRFEWEHWFLDWDGPEDTEERPRDARSSCLLEVAATQFEVQGLELDWVGVCWGEDFVRVDSAWKHFRFDNKKWTPVRRDRKQQYLTNAYRVLLTRARQGMVLYVPEASSAIWSRHPERLDETAAFLMQCGAVPAGLRA